MNLKNNNANTKIKQSKNTVSDSVGSYEKHPFFIKKASTAKALLLKVGLPKELAKKSHA